MKQAIIIRNKCFCALKGCRQCGFNLHCGKCEASHRDNPAKQLGRISRTRKEDRQNDIR